ncbi:hypothetical protein SAMN02910369_00121 [Lachnospiraceae bacterium NE2001]|nr:hypothetical protein SAMN02910369_00121 [Lachnospiraceae bacterium NE2001]
MNKKKYKKLMSILLITGMSLSMCGCGSNVDEVHSEGMKKVGSLYVEEEAEYTDDSEKEEVLDSFSSADGLCVIDKYPTYYDVTLDYEKGEPDAVGKAYAEAIIEAVPDYAENFEPYLHENIRQAFGGREVNNEALEKRIRTLIDSLPGEYKLEVESFAKTISQGEEGYAEDGKISYIEALTMQIIPDALRPTACSALSLGGEKTVSGERISIRNLEWNAGSENQFAELHAVTHMKKGDRSLTSISILGLLDMITAVNDDGVMIAILDVGSKYGMPFIYEGKKCYTFEIRYALENFDNAKDAGEYLVGESGDFTWCNNLLCTDAKDAFCCENATSEVQASGNAKSVLRTTDSELMEGLQWDTPDALCIVNTFATQGNQDTFTSLEFNITRFVKYNKWVSEKDKFSVADAKGLMAREVVDQYGVSNVHNSGTVHTVIVDYATGKIHVSFTKEETAEDIPRFIEIGEY